jgi:transcriptional regulator
MVDMLGGFKCVRDIQKRIAAPSLRGQRDTAILAARDQGWTLTELALATGLSRERIRFIEKKMRTGRDD